jgi:hypothetical protein
MKTLVFLFLVSISATAQNVKDTFLIIVPEDYKVGQEVIDVYDESTSSCKDSDSTSYTLFYYRGVYHQAKNNAEFFGLIGKKNESPVIKIERADLIKYKARYLKQYYSLLNGDLYYSKHFLSDNEPSFVRSMLRRELHFYVVHQEDYLNSDILKLYSCGYRYISIKL